MSAASIDPYVEWLGLPPGSDSPDHYALLGLPRGEADKGRIDDAFRARYAVVRNYQIKWPDLATRVLNELSNASLCLTDPVRKAEYDRALGLSNPLVSEPSPGWVYEGDDAAVLLPPSYRPLPELPRQPSVAGAASAVPLSLPDPDPLPQPNPELEPQPFDFATVVHTPATRPQPEPEPEPEPEPAAEPQPFVRMEDLIVWIREALPVLLASVAAMVLMIVLGVIIFSSRSRPKAVPDAADEPPTQTARPATPVPPLPPNEVEAEPPVPPGKAYVKKPIALPTGRADIGNAPSVKLALQPGDVASPDRIFLARPLDPDGVLVSGTRTPTATARLFNARNRMVIPSPVVMGFNPRGITDVSPDGWYIVALEATPGNVSAHPRSTVSIWDTRQQRTVEKDYAPPAQLSWRDGQLVGMKVVVNERTTTGNGVVWAGFVADNHLLILKGHGGFDIRTIPGLERKCREEGLGEYFDNLVTLNRVPDPPYSPFPRGFALSPDRKTLARFTGDKIQFFDTTTGEKKAETDTLGGKSQPGFGVDGRLTIDLTGMAFDPRGTTLAVVYRSPAVGGGQFDLYKRTTGKRTGGGPLDHVVAAAPGNHVRWWGEFVVMAESTKHTPIDPYTREVLATIWPPSEGAFLPDTRTGLLWAFGPSTRGGPPYVYALAAPPTLPAAPRSFTATPEGLVEGRR